MLNFFLNSGIFLQNSCTVPPSAGTVPPNSVDMAPAANKESPKSDTKIQKRR